VRDVLDMLVQRLQQQFGLGGVGVISHAVIFTSTTPPRAPGPPVEPWQSRRDCLAATGGNPRRDGAKMCYENRNSTYVTESSLSTLRNGRRKSSGPHADIQHKEITSATLPIS
jgi:hypothetical protein